MEKEQAAESDSPADAMLQPLTSLVNRVVWQGSPTTRVRNVPGDLEPIVGSSKKAPETKRTDNHAPDGKGEGVLHC